MKKNNRMIIYGVLFAISLIITIAGIATDNEGVFAPMLMADQVLLTIWLFKPQARASKTAYYAIISYGVFIALLSIFFTVFGPALSDANGWETHSDDRNGITYPAVNDGRENCYFTSTLFLFYFVISLVQRFVMKKKYSEAV